MTTLILGLDGLDGEYVSETGLLKNLDAGILHQDFEGKNALYTYRVWNNIMAGERGGADHHSAYSPYEPDGSYLWEKYPAEALCVPVQNPSYSVDTEAFPAEYLESYAPEGRIEDAFDRLEAGIRDAISRDVPLVVACTRTPDIVGHHLPKEADYWISRLCGMVERWVRRADDYLLVSDHGFDYEPWGGKGIEAHTRRATFASSFCEYDVMSEFVSNWHDDVADNITESQMKALGYRV